MIKKRCILLLKCWSISASVGKLLYDLEWNNGTVFRYTLDDDKKECSSALIDVGVLRPNWLDGATYLGQQFVDGFHCNVWQKVDFIWYYEDIVTKRPVHWVFYTGTLHPLNPPPILERLDILIFETNVVWSEVEK